MIWTHYITKGMKWSQAGPNLHAKPGRKGGSPFSAPPPRPRGIPPLTATHKACWHTHTHKTGHPFASCRPRLREAEPTQETHAAACVNEQHAALEPWFGHPGSASKNVIFPLDNQIIVSLPSSRRSVYCMNLKLNFIVAIRGLNKKRKV